MEISFRPFRVFPRPPVVRSSCSQLSLCPLLLVSAGLRGLTKTAALFIVFSEDVYSVHGQRLVSLKGRVLVRRALFLVSLAASLLLIGAGVLLGDPARVFANAVIVCLSCIGIQ